MFPGNGSLPNGVRTLRFSDVFLHFTYIVMGAIRGMWLAPAKGSRCRVLVRFMLIAAIPSAAYWLCRAIVHLGSLTLVFAAGIYLASLVFTGLMFVGYGHWRNRHYYFNKSGTAFLAIDEKGGDAILWVKASTPYLDASEHVSVRRGQGRVVRLALAPFLAQTGLDLRLTASSPRVAREYRADLPKLKVVKTHSRSGRIDMVLPAQPTTTPVAGDTSSN